MALYRACVWGRKDDVRQLIRGGHDVNAYDESGWTPLLVAAYNGHVEVARELIRANADVNLKVRESDRSVLYTAAYYICQAWVKFYLLVMFILRVDEQAAGEVVGANSDVLLKVRGSSRSVLYTAVYYVCQAFVKLSLLIMNLMMNVSYEIDEQEFSFEGRTALMLAIQRRHSDVVAELVKAGADISLKDKKGMTAVLLAKSYDIVVQLVRDVDHKRLSREDRSRILWHACDVGDLSMVKSVIEAGCDEDHIHKGQTPVMMATLRGHDSIVKELILANCDVNLHSKGYFSDLASSLSMAKVIWPTLVVWIGFVVAFFGSVLSSLDNRVVPSWVNPVTGSVAVLVSPVCATAGVMFPFSWPMALLMSSLFVSSAVTTLAVVAMVAGPECRALALVMALVVPLLMCGPRAIMSTTVMAFKFILRFALFILVLLLLIFVVVLAGLADWWPYLLTVGFAVIVVNSIGQSKGNWYSDMQATLSMLWFVFVFFLCQILVLARSWTKHHAQSVMIYILMMAWLNVYKASRSTALHYAAGHNRIKCGALLVEAGADVRAENICNFSPLEIGSKTFVDEVQKVASFTTKRVIAVIGNSEHGKSTLVAALECTSGILWKKAVNRFKKVRDIRQRTAGIEAVQVSNQKYGEALFYDFAGQSQYHGPHQSFLEAMLSKPEASVTLLLLVKATDEEDIITQQLYRWLQPLALMSIPITPKIVVVGSFLDQVKSEKEESEKLLRCTQSVNTELALDIQGPCLLDCRQPESKGINQICALLQEAHPVNTKALSYNLHWVLVQVRKACPFPALPLHEFRDKVVNLPKKLPSLKKVCQDLSAAGHTLYLPSKQVRFKNWLILDLPGLLHTVYGTLFSGSQNNKFGLLHCSKLAELFPQWDQEMVQEVLISLEFCIECDPTLLREEMARLTVDAGCLYFPALVSAQPSKVFPDDPDPEQFKWLCWQLRTAEKHFISARLLQTIILRLAANHVFTHELSSSEREPCCCVWVNGLSWRSTKGVDVAVQISDSSVVQVVGRSKEGRKELFKYVSTVVGDITKTISQLSSKLEATPYIVHPYAPTLWKDPKAIQTDSLYPVSSINRCISNGDRYVLSLLNKDDDHPQQMSLSEVFGWLPSLPVVQDMDFADPSSSSAGEWNAAIVLPFQLQSVPSYAGRQIQACIVLYIVPGSYRSVWLKYL